MSGIFSEDRTHYEQAMITELQRCNESQEPEPRGEHCCSARPRGVRQQHHEHISMIVSAVEACRSDQSAALIWELFAGCAPTTPAAVRGGHNAGEPIDLVHGFGLQDLMAVEAAIWAIKAYPPGARHSGLPSQSLVGYAGVE